MPTVRAQRVGLQVPPCARLAAQHVLCDLPAPFTRPVNAVEKELARALAARRLPAEQLSPGSR
jgi:hypothetical protein